MKYLSKFRGTLTVRQSLIQLFINGLCLFLAIQLVDSVRILNGIGVFSTVIVATILHVILRPIFEVVARFGGLVGILAISFFGNAAVVWLSMELLPSIEITSFIGGFTVAWIYAVVVTFSQWLFLSQSDDVYLGLLTRDVKVKNKQVSDKTGFIFIQLDGVSAAVLDWQLKAGNLPNIAKLLRQKDYRFDTWHTQIPSTTPASQAGLLFGNNDDIPAFRWYEKDTGQLVVANQTAGASLIEKRCSNGDGLLADGGVSVGNLFSGDAQQNIMVMSKLDAKHRKQSVSALRQYSAYFYGPHGFVRSFILAIGEISKEVYQARRQVRLDMQPRIKRHGSYIILRAATNVLMRDLQTSIVVTNMMTGVNSLYVDYLDYDEVAHHAGPARSESLASLSGLDRVVGILDKAKAYAERPYELIILSDHGQSQGTTFRQLHQGKTLQDIILSYLPDMSIQAELEPVEQQTMMTSLTNKEVVNSKNSKVDAPIVVTGSGNLGNVWFTKHKKRLMHEDIESLFPHLIDKLLQTNGIGLVIMQSKNGPIVLGKDGSILLKDASITGKSPLETYHFSSTESLLKLATHKHAPDICLISTYDEDTAEVHAFEELVGNHGGIGGWQTEAIFLHPEHLKVQKKFLKNGELYDATTIHGILKTWLKDAGHSTKIS